MKKIDLYEDIVWHHEIPIQLRFSDMDRFGHMNNSVYFSIFDTAKMDYFEKAIGKEFSENYAIVMAHVTANYLAPIYFPGEILVQMSIIHLGNKSFTIIQRVLDPETREIKCVCKSIMLTYNVKENKSVVMPDNYKKMIMEFEQKTFSESEG